VKSNGLRIIACYSSKGGVGKTSSAVNLAAVAAAEGRSTLLIDLDQQGAASFYFRIRSPDRHRARRLLEDANWAARAIRETDFERLHLLPAHRSYRNFDVLLSGMQKSRTRLRKLIREVAPGYQTIVLDCPPSLGRVAENVFSSADVVLVPVIPTTLSLRTFEQLDEFFARAEFDRGRLHPFFSMVDSRRRMHRQTIQSMRETEKRLLETRIPYCAEIEAMGLDREPIVYSKPGHRGSVAFRNLWREVELLAPS